MSCNYSEVAVCAKELGKAYAIYKKPIDRLKQMIWRHHRQYYDTFWALEDVNLELFQGETVGIIGRNGSGKSTFLQIICGTLAATCGHISVHGRIAALLELGAGFNPEFTGRENVYLAASVLGLSEEEINARYSSIEKFAEIGDFINHPVKLYSSGMYARLAFAVAAHVDAEILIVDEILAVGDAAFNQKCMRFIREFKKQGTLLFVSHDIGSVVNLCDRVVWLDSGRVREIGSAKEVCHHYSASLYGEKSINGSFRIGSARTQATQSVVDPRSKMLKDSDKRNIIQLFDFDSDATWFGERAATIRQTVLCNNFRQPLTMLEGGEEVILRIECEILRDLSSPIVGFSVKDKLGQHLFGDNTYLSYQNNPVSAHAGESLVGEFHFQLPFLPTGTYSVNVAIAEGTQHNHQQQHWVEDAMFFVVESSHIVRGLVGIPMINISLGIEESIKQEQAN